MFILCAHCGPHPILIRKIGMNGGASRLLRSLRTAGHPRRLARGRPGQHGGRGGMRNGGGACRGSPSGMDLGRSLVPRGLATTDRKVCEPLRWPRRFPGALGGAPRSYRACYCPSCHRCPPRSRPSRTRTRVFYAWPSDRGLPDWTHGGGLCIGDSGRPRPGPPLASGSLLAAVPDGVALPSRRAPSAGMAAGSAGTTPSLHPTPTASNGLPGSVRVLILLETVARGRLYGHAIGQEEDPVT